MVRVSGGLIIPGGPAGGRMGLFSSRWDSVVLSRVCSRRLLAYLGRYVLKGNSRARAIYAVVQCSYTLLCTRYVHRVCSCDNGNVTIHLVGPRKI